MYYNPVYPQMFQPQQFQPQQRREQSGDVEWVQGEAAAKAYPVAPGHSVMLLDSEKSVFYLKSADASGMPLPLRIFEYSEKKEASAPQGDYLTREEFDKALADLRAELLKKEETEDA